VGQTYPLFKRDARAVICVRQLIDKKFLFTGGSVRNVLLYVKNILPQDVGFVTDGRVEGTIRQPFFCAICSPFGLFTRESGIFYRNQTDHASFS
jgi:tRNA nucleotidyltransferase/poly(A) polymerase